MSETKRLTELSDCYHRSGGEVREMIVLFEAEIERLQIENQSIRDVLEADKKPHHQLCLELTTLRNELVALQSTKVAAEAAEGKK